MHVRISHGHGMRVACAGKSFGMDDVEWELAQLGVVETELKVNPHRRRER